MKKLLLALVALFSLNSLSTELASLEATLTKVQELYQTNIKNGDELDSEILAYSWLSMRFPNSTVSQLAKVQSEITALARKCLFNTGNDDEVLDKISGDFASFILERNELSFYRLTNKNSGSCVMGVYEDGMLLVFNGGSQD